MPRELKYINEQGQRVYEDTNLVAVVKIRLVKEWTELGKGHETGQDLMFLCDIVHKDSGFTTGFSEHFKPGNTGVQRRAVLKRLGKRMAESL